MKNNNPIVKGKGVCDPHIHIFNDRAYLYASHDYSMDNPTWLMHDWQIWSSDDLITWKYESTLRPEDTYIGESDRCWAVDAAHRDGKYYLYFSNANIDSGVACSDSPAGPFADPIGKPILPKDLTPSLQYDLTVFEDPDTGIYYLVWGNPEGDGYYISRLNEDMVSLAEAPKSILIDGGPARDDKNKKTDKKGQAKTVIRLSLF